MDATPLRVAEVKPSHQVLDIDIDAILDIQRENDDGLTTAEWAEALKCSERRVRAMLKAGVPRGLFSVGKRYGKNWDGRNMAFQVYRYTKSE